LGDFASNPYYASMNDPNDHQIRQDPANRDELRWLWIRVGVRIGIGLLVVGVTLGLILGAG
jgi:hypothetical protein